MDSHFAAVRLLGVTIHAVTATQTLDYIAAAIRAGRRAVIANVNAHAMNIAYEQPWFRDFLNRSDLVFCDGFGVKWAARLTGQSLPERITYADWAWQLADWAERGAYSLFFLGARPGVAEIAADRLRARYPRLRVVGIQHGYFGAADTEAIVQAINAARPHILVLGMGMPTQERWLQENWPRLNANVALTGGAVFDYISGEVRRGPRWMTDHGLEWLARLIIEPRRLWKRYIVGNPQFLWRVWRER